MPSIWNYSHCSLTNVEQIHGIRCQDGVRIRNQSVMAEERLWQRASNTVAAVSNTRRISLLGNARCSRSTQQPLYKLACISLSFNVRPPPNWWQHRAVVTYYFQWSVPIHTHCGMTALNLLSLQFGASIGEICFLHFISFKKHSGNRHSKASTGAKAI